MSVADHAPSFPLESIAQEAEQFFRDLRAGTIPDQRPAWQWLGYGQDIAITQPWSEPLEKVIRAAFQLYRHFHIGKASEWTLSTARRIFFGIQSRLENDFARQDRVLALALEAGLSELEVARLVLSQQDPFSYILQGLLPIGPEKLSYDEFKSKHGWNANFADFISADQVAFRTRLAQFVWELSDEQWSELLPLDLPPFRGEVIRLLATFRPKAVHLWLKRIVDSGSTHHAGCWSLLPGANREFDDACWQQVERLREYCAHPPEGISASMFAFQAWWILGNLMELRPEVHEARILQIAEDPLLGAGDSTISWFNEHHPELGMRMLVRAITQPPYPLNWEYIGENFFRVASLRILSDGRAAFDAVCETRNAVLAVSSLPNLLEHAPADATSEKTEVIGKYLSLFKAADDQEQMWTALVKQDVQPILPLAWEALSSKSKKVRKLAAEGVHRCLGDTALEQVRPLLRDKRVESRLGAVELVAKLAPATAAPLLQDILTTESADKVRGAVHAVLQKLPASAIQGDSTNPTVAAQPGGADSLLREFNEKLGPSGAMPKWLNPDTLPPLALHGPGSGCELLARWISLQSKFGDIAPAPDSLALLPHIDREKGGDLGLAILEAWLAAGADVKTRWALVLAGWLGDERIVPPLSENIPAWCDQARHKVAGYAAQALALQGGDAATRVLHACSVQYRQHFPNVGAAASQGLATIATHRGLSRSRLSETSLPWLGFNEEGVQVWSHEKWTIQGAVDFRGNFVLKNLADNTPFETWPPYTPWMLVSDVDEFGRVLRRLMKEQVLHHEEAAREGRSWPFASWAQLYHAHPLRRHLGSCLIWTAWDDSARPTGTFHLDTHGQTADAQGQPLGKEPTTVTLATSAQLTKKEIKDWKARFASLQLKSPLRQFATPPAS